MSFNDKGKSIFQGFGGKNRKDKKLKLFGNEKETKADVKNEKAPFFAPVQNDMSKKQDKAIPTVRAAYVIPKTSQGGVAPPVSTRPATTPARAVISASPATHALPAKTGGSPVSAKIQQPKSQFQHQPKPQQSPQQSKQPAKPAAVSVRPQSNNGKNNHNNRKGVPVKIIPLGGVCEIGKNIYIYECANDIVIVDCGMAFPDDEMPGVDIVLPDFSYLIENFSKIRGIVITHGHEDHIGGVPYLLKNINVPVYGSKLALGLIEGKLKEHNNNNAKLIVTEARQTVHLGCMAVEFIHVNHSIPGAYAFALHTPAGIIVHTGDFKVDYTPIQGEVIDLARFGELGTKGVLALLGESTNAERPGYSRSERKVSESFSNIFKSSTAANKRIIVATFASNVHRIQQIVDAAAAEGRYVAVSGRSMVNVVAKAIELNYIKIPEGMLVDIENAHSYRPEQLVVITTGSQGEPLSALTRMSNGEHKQVRITASDLIIISATPIPGNEKFVGRLVNDLLMLGADVVYEAMYEVHVSGHAYQDELKMMLSLVRPKFFVPIHGEFKHMKKHASLANEMGIPEENIFVIGNGVVIETDGVTMKAEEKVTAGRVLVDGIGVGDVGSIVLRDRKRLAEDGLIIIGATVSRNKKRIVAGPDIVSRGFVYVRESEELLIEARELMRTTLLKLFDNNSVEWGVIKSTMRDELSDLIYKRTKRNPMILPVIMEG